MQEPIGSLLFTCNGRGEAGLDLDMHSVVACAQLRSPDKGLYGERHVDARALQEALGEELGQLVPHRFGSLARGVCRARCSFVVYCSCNG